MEIKLKPSIQSVHVTRDHPTDALKITGKIIFRAPDGIFIAESDVNDHLGLRVELDVELRNAAQKFLVAFQTACEQALRKNWS